MINHLIDIGSSTIKLYERKNTKVFLIEQKTIDFKNGFTPINGLSDANKKALFDYFFYLVTKYSLSNDTTKLYATGIFRDIDDKQSIINEFFDNTGLFLNIITHELEAFYLEKAWIHQESKCIKKMLVINIGGKTTELLLCDNGVVRRIEKLSIGVGTLLNDYPKMNLFYSEYSLDFVVNEVIKDISKQLSPNHETYEIAIYTGGELNYMKRANYKLIPNSIFNDLAHPFMIESFDFYSKNNYVFSNISIDELKNMMPKNPEWMKGARACSALAQAICKYYKVKIIIPSDSNLIDGVTVQEAKNVVICGSFNKHLEQIKELIGVLNKKNISVLSPRNTEVIGSEDDFLILKNDSIVNHNTWAVEELHLRAIDKCDFVIACNYDNYIGVSTTFELDYAYRNNKKIVFIENNEIARNFGKRIGKHPMPCEIGIL